MRMCKCVQGVYGGESQQCQTSTHACMHTRTHAQTHISTPILYTIRGAMASMNTPCALSAKEADRGKHTKVPPSAGHNLFCPQHTHNSNSNPSTEVCIILYRYVLCMYTYNYRDVWLDMFSTGLQLATNKCFASQHFNVDLSVLSLNIRHRSLPAETHMCTHKECCTVQCSMVA